MFTYFNPVIVALTAATIFFVALGILHEAH